ncbi:MAG: serine/threonine protein kinase [Xanthomonadaceae bacterium]|nr:serine/threonine protein kinase [Xanthomonadaceae bacterium]
MDDKAPYYQLSPDVVLDAVEATGRSCDGRLLALNSYENRVYQVGIDDEQPVVAKFYRPGRWTDEAILEEHAFALEIAAHEIPLVAPLADDDVTLHRHAGFRFALFPRRGGRSAEPDDLDQLNWIGRFIGRIHAVAATRPFAHRPRVDVESYVLFARTWLLENNCIPGDLLPAWTTTLDALLPRIDAAFQRAGDYREMRLHGDCHLGNILWTHAGPHFVDLDDCRTGPAIQDLWMLLSGDRRDMTLQLAEVLDGYEEFHDFNRRELHLVEALRAMRMIHHSAWLAQRWEDPAFPAAFPWFGGQRYWEEQVLALREQLALLDEPALDAQA